MYGDDMYHECGVCGEQYLYTGVSHECGYVEEEEEPLSPTGLASQTLDLIELRTFQVRHYLKSGSFSWDELQTVNEELERVFEILRDLYPAPRKPVETSNNPDDIPF